MLGDWTVELIDDCDSELWFLTHDWGKCLGGFEKKKLGLMIQQVKHNDKRVKYRTMNKKEKTV